MVSNMPEEKVGPKILPSSHYLRPKFFSHENRCVLATRRTVLKGNGPVEVGEEDDLWLGL